MIGVIYNMNYKILTPIKAIRKKFLDCSYNQFSEVRECSVMSCPIYPYRYGRRPKTNED